MIFVKAIDPDIDIGPNTVYVNASRIDTVHEIEQVDGKHAVIVVAGKAYRVPLDGFAHLEDFIQQLDHGLEEVEA